MSWLYLHAKQPNLAGWKIDIFLCFAPLLLYIIAMLKTTLILLTARYHNCNNRQYIQYILKTQ